jgi:WD40 repeat protein
LRHTGFSVPAARLCGDFGRPFGLTLGDDVRHFHAIAGAASRSSQKVAAPDALCAAFSPDGRWFLIGSSDKQIRQFDSDSLAMVTSFPVPAAPKALAISPNGRRFACAGDDRVVRVWDLNSPKERGHTPIQGGAVQTIAFTRDGRHALSAGNDAVIHLWNLPRERK